jgi:hypothetical protein
VEPVAVGDASVVHYSLGQLKGGFESFAVVDGVKGSGLAEVGGVGHGVEGGHFRVVVGKALPGEDAVDEPPSPLRSPEDLPFLQVGVVQLPPRPSEVAPRPPVISPGVFCWAG